MRLLLLTGLVLCLGLCGVQAAPPAVEFIAHRGESADAPENTLAAFQLAWERKVPTIELDVHLTRDGALILCHDPNTERTTGVRKAIKDSTLEELRALDAGKWKGAQWAGQKLPTLDEALATIPAGGRCFIEIKVGPEAVPAVAAAVQKCGKRPDQLVIISFRADVVAEAKRQLPQLEAYYLAKLRKDPVSGAVTPSVQELIQRAKASHADGLDLDLGEQPDPAVVQQVKAAGFKLYTWTVDNPEVARRLVALKVDGITSNRAAWLRTRVAE